MTGAKASKEGGTRAFRALGIGLVVGVLIGLGVGRFAGRVPAEEPPLLDARLPLANHGAVFAFTLTQATAVRVRVRLENCTSAGEAVVGPLLPAMRPHLVFEPDPEQDLRFPIQAGETAVFETDLLRAGMYAVRILGIPRAMGSENQPQLHVVVRAIARGSQASAAHN